MANSKQRRTSRRKCYLNLNNLVTLIKSRIELWKDDKFSKDDIVNEFNRIITEWDREKIW